MGKTIIGPGPIEPAHSSVVKLQEDLFYIYQLIRDKLQVKIDKAFNDIARQYGFVVTTSIPITLTLDESGTVMGVVVTDGKPIQDSIILKEMNHVFDLFKKSKFPQSISTGDFNIYLFWYEALKIKLKTDWIEPAHYRVFSQFEHYKFDANTSSSNKYRNLNVKPDVIEPVHWFDPKSHIEVEEAVLINVIDEIYPELQLTTKISAARSLEKVMEVPSDVKEPVHFRLGQLELELKEIRNLLLELNTKLTGKGR